MHRHTAASALMALALLSPFGAQAQSSAKSGTTTIVLPAPAQAAQPVQPAPVAPAPALAPAGRSTLAAEPQGATAQAGLNDPIGAAPAKAKSKKKVKAAHAGAKTKAHKGSAHATAAASGVRAHQVADTKRTRAALKATPMTGKVKPRPVKKVDPASGANDGSRP
ncbi:MAG: hypothetical protein AB9M60_06215 [Leptothrix sp. (in: b-proteobacteria)]